MRKYNRIYNVLLKEEDDFVGMVAYSIYKKSKKDFIERFQTKNNRQPNEDDLETFHESSLLDGTISGYWNLAETKIADFMTDLYEHEIDEIKKDYDDNLNKIKNDYIQKLEEIQNLKSPGFWRGVYQSVLGTLGYTLLIGSIIFIAWAFKFGIKNVIESISGYKMVKQEVTDTQSKPRKDSQSHLPQTTNK